MSVLMDRPAPEPKWGEEEFAHVMREMAMGEAPRLFSIVEEYGERIDARVAGYGLAYETGVEVNSVEGDFHLKSESPESARRLFELSAQLRGARTHVVWVDNPTKPVRLQERDQVC
ncbi:hypothetical protein ACQPZF_14145 [Actinosynnema sp. CS-041913]|uniref:hypothetical protein n=1 Tax=Actinosynnema sp. CS-041913 TaxID=3239917 RepID=UPI003D9185AD